jgi:hypothetical protein
MTMLYVDDYERIAGRWYFRRRLPLYWYAADPRRPPVGDKKMRWPAASPRRRLPHWFLLAGVLARAPETSPCAGAGAPGSWRGCAAADVSAVRLRDTLPESFRARIRPCPRVRLGRLLRRLRREHRFIVRLPPS